jgi:hypothetical protein
MGIQGFLPEGLLGLCPQRGCLRTYEQKRARLTAFQLPTTVYSCTFIAATQLLTTQLYRISIL